MNIKTPGFDIEEKYDDLILKDTKSLLGYSLGKLYKTSDGGYETRNTFGKNYSVDKYGNVDEVEEENSYETSEDSLGCL